MHVWVGPETLAAIVAQQFPERLPNGVPMVGDHWADAEQAQADSRR